MGIFKKSKILQELRDVRDEWREELRDARDDYREELRERRDEYHQALRERRDEYHQALRDQRDEFFHGFRDARDKIREGISRIGFDAKTTFDSQESGDSQSEELDCHVEVVEIPAEIFTSNGPNRDDSKRYDVVLSRVGSDISHLAIVITGFMDRSLDQSKELLTKHKEGRMTIVAEGVSAEDAEDMIRNIKAYGGDAFTL